MDDTKDSERTIAEHDAATEQALPDLAVPADDADRVKGGVTGPCDRPKK